METNESMTSNEVAVKIASGFFGGQESMKRIIDSRIAADTEGNWDGFRKVWSEGLQSDQAALEKEIQINKNQITISIGEATDMQDMLDNWSKYGKPEGIDEKEFKAVCEIINGKHSSDSGYAKTELEYFGFYQFDIADKLNGHKSELKDFVLNSMAVIRTLRNSEALKSVSASDHKFVTALTEFIKKDGDEKFDQSLALSVTEPEKVGQALREVALARIILNEQAKKLYESLELKTPFGDTSIGWHTQEMTDFVDQNLHPDDLDISNPTIGINGSRSNFAGALISYFVYGPGKTTVN